MRRHGEDSTGHALGGLKLRTFAVALAMAALLATGLWLGLSALAQMPSSTPGPDSVHLPSAPATGNPRIPIVRALMGLLVALALFGFSTARFGRLSPAWLLVLVALIGAWSHWVGLPLAPLPLHAVPGSVERAVARQTPEQVDQLMRQRGAGEHTRHYVLAQMALRDGQREALRQHGAAVLDEVDRVTYGSLQEARGSEALRFDPGVVARLDRGMHGEPLSEPGLRQAAGTGPPAPTWIGPWSRLLLGVLALLAGLVVARLWLTMQRRVVEVALDAGQPDPARAADDPRAPVSASPPAPP